MAVKKFALEVGGPKRLTVSWGFRWKDFVVRLDDQEVGRISGGFDALRLGESFALPNGSSLRAQLVMEKSWAGKVPQLHLYVDGKPVPGSEAVPLPRWAYLFIAACVAIPIVTLGGAIPAGIGGGGAAACAALARDESNTTGKRIVYCVAVTALCWAAFGTFLTLVGLAHNR
jgi:hypothetical protein